MDTHTLIELAAKAVEVIGMLEENRAHEREGIGLAYDSLSFCEVAEEIRKLQIRKLANL